ncbi:Hint domain-containing protein [Pseudoruegeria sp. SHC-113]|uniref:Hint domain-containing protein n=1 Tax=Pseudoruegeria sp. SHC-113 TaxID=2855439 RepID=UPI0021BA5EFE|nr:Hint domain-containing protein [Pseudoruegeria sp. SHC-113]MCT8161147.1 Hint domain-containing protein [Pseudoruegeria sp. SHC-113]
MLPLPAGSMLPLQTLPVFRAEAFVAVDGANLGDPLSDASELVLDDTYALTEGARRGKLAIAVTPDGPFRVSDGSDIGEAGNQIHLDSTITLMSPDGATMEALVLAEVNPDEGYLVEVYLLPLADLAPKTDYRLVGVESDTAKARFAEVACVSFARGTHITLSDGRQRPIEDLQVGDKVLTRDDGPQTIRWIGQTTMRAVGDFAPIVIRRGTLNNANDLTVSPNHRLFIYQRRDEIGLGRSEVLVKAKHLVNGESVFRQDGGFVDYFQILFDRHHIIYAEGIAAESLLLDRRTTPALPQDLAHRLSNLIPGHADRPHKDFEIHKSLLSANAVDDLRRASDR